MQNENFHSPYLSGSRLYRALDRVGIVVMEAPSGPDDLNMGAMPRDVVGEAAFRAAAQANSTQVTPREAVADISDYSTISNPMFPPSVRGFYVAPSAPEAVTVDLLDSWNLLTESATRSAEFHANLFSRLRLMRFPRDKIGERVNNWFANRAAVRVPVEPGQVLLLNNHRFACRVLAGAVVPYQAWNIWMKLPFASPDEEHMALAQAFRERLKVAVDSEAPSSAALFGSIEGSPEELLKNTKLATQSPEDGLAAFKRVFLALEQS
jgi:hypothetical protein